MRRGDALPLLLRAVISQVVRCTGEFGIGQLCVPLLSWAQGDLYVSGGILGDYLLYRGSSLRGCRVIMRPVLLWLWCWSLNNVLANMAGREEVALSC